MELESFQRIVLAAALAVLAGMASWLLARLGLILWEFLASRSTVGLPMPAAPGDRARRLHRRLGRHLSAWLGSLLAAIAVFTLVMLQAPARIDMQVPGWGWIVAAILVVGDSGFVAYMLYRLFRERRSARYSWAMRRAIGGVLERLSLHGYRIFHEVAIEDSVLDHVVLGEKGIFSINTIARRPKRKDETRGVKLKAGKLGFSDGRVEGIPVGDAARKLSLLGGELTRIVGHRVMVKSILAVPGWNSQPDADANHLLLNENNLVTMASWNTAEAHLMQEDLPGLERFLANACSVESLD